MPSRKHCSGFNHFIRSALQDLSKDLYIQAVRKCSQIQRHLRLSAHGIYITEGICRSDLSKQIRVIHNRGKKVNRLDHCQIVINFIDRSII